MHEIDSIWAIKIKTDRKIIKSAGANTHYGVWYAKKSNDILLVKETQYPVADEKTKFWIYDYHFRNGQLFLITKWNNTHAKDKDRKICHYYFRNGELLYKHEFRVSIANLPDEIKKAYFLRERFKKP
ncbi:MAG: hypothetical protein EOP53_16150 [Sphingobacteriales bacterium]|nr:MAG: hypothetical protein EOP53_16150 [Sphingobacteriales bacterium]